MAKKQNKSTQRKPPSQKKSSATTTNTMNGTYMNISPQNIAGTCESKCSYAFNYPTTNSTTVSNYGAYLQFTYELSNTSPVLYNNKSYNVSSITLYSPSLHKYNSATANGEVVIRHSPVNGGNPLYVVIPLSTGGLTTGGSQVVSRVINAASKSAPSAGKNTNKGVGEFSLNSFIPMKQFYSYTTSKLDCIVFDISNAIGISTDDLSIFKKIITAAPSNPFTQSTSLFINTKGPTNSITGGGSDIYIDCQPTDQVMGTVTKDKKSINDLGPQENLMYLVYVVVFMFFTIFYNEIHYQLGRRF